MPDEPIVHPDLQNLHSHAGNRKNFFPGQRETEHVHLCIRRHWLVELGIFGRFFVLAIVTPLIILTIASVFDYLFGLRLMNSNGVFLLGVALYLLFVWLYTFIEFMKNELSIVLITNERVIDIEQTSLFDHRILEANLDRIQDVLGTMRGFLGTFFDVGDLEIQTAGTEFAIISKTIKHPQFTARKILNIQRQSLSQRRAIDQTRTSSPPITTLRRRTGDDGHLSDAEILKLRGLADNRRASDQRNSIDGV